MKRPATLKNRDEQDQQGGNDEHPKRALQSVVREVGHERTNCGDAACGTWWPSDRGRALAATNSEFAT